MPNWLTKNKEVIDWSKGKMVSESVDNKREQNGILVLDAFKSLWFYVNEMVEWESRIRLLILKINKIEHVSFRIWRRRDILINGFPMMNFQLQNLELHIVQNYSKTPSTVTLHSSI